MRFHRVLALAALVATGLAGTCPPVEAQVTAPRFVEFTASADHDVRLPDGRPAVSFYQLEVLLAGAAAPFHVASLGKPTPNAAGTIVHDLSTTPIAWPVNGGTYVVRVTAVGPQGEGRSAPSPPFTVGGASLPAASPGSATYEVGPNQAHATLADVPWASLGPGSLVRIHWRPEPYKEKWMVSASGTEAAPIVIQGVPSSTGALPVIDGNGAMMTGPGRAATDPLGVVVIAPASDTAPPPSHIVIERLEIRGAGPSSRYVSATGTSTAYATAAASLYLVNAHDVSVRDCVIQDSSQGLVVASTGSEASRRVRISGTHVFGNGRASRTTEHNVRLEGIDITFEGNRLGPLRAGALGTGLRDGSAGLVVRYNWIEGGSRELDLIDARNSVVRAAAGYRETFVYGNVILEPAADDMAAIVRYGGDSGTTTRYRQGTLYFYNNTVVSGRLDATYLLELSTAGETADLRNNIVATPGGSLVVAHGAGRVALGRNWLPAGYLATSSTFTGTLTDAGLVLTGAAPGFVDAARQDFALAATSPGIDAASALAPAALSRHEVTGQYVRHLQRVVRPKVGPPDLGAFESGVTTPVTYRVTGRVADTSGAALAGVSVQATGAMTASTLTATNGTYALAGLPRGGTVTITPSLGGYGFTPASATLSNLAGDRVVDFVAARLPNVPPTVTLTAPAHGTTLTAPASVTLQATAADADGRVVRVDFFVDAARANYDTTAPFSRTVAGLAAGTYTLTAAAVDDRGAVVTSNPAVITVRPTPILVLPAADTYVRGGKYASTNYGSATTLYVRQTTAALYHRETYLLFDLTEPVAGRQVFLRVRPRLTADSAEPVVVAVRALASTAWTDASFTYDIRPVPGSSVLGSFAVTSRTAAWVDVDLTAYVRAEWDRGRRRVALALQGVGESAVPVSLRSREATSDRPVLVIQP